MTGFVHRFDEGGRERPLLLLHGTGGDEHDLIGLGRRVAPGRALLSPRGRVLENGMPRFFRRFAEGRFDHDDVRREADALAAFVTERRAALGLGAPIAVGFSNGANIAAALLHRHAGVLAGAVLLRAMTPLPEPPSVRLDGMPVLIVSGALDPIVRADDAAGLASRLMEAGAASITAFCRPGTGSAPRTSRSRRVRSDALPFGRATCEGGSHDRSALAHALALLDRVPLIDGHNDLPIVVRHRAGGDLRAFDMTRHHPGYDTDIPRLRAGKVAAQFWAAYVPTATQAPDGSRSNRSTSRATPRSPIRTCSCTRRAPPTWRGRAGAD